MPKYFPTDRIGEAPRPVCDCIAYLRRHHLQTVGILRENPNHERLQELGELYDELGQQEENDNIPLGKISVLERFGKKHKTSERQLGLYAGSLLKRYFTRANDQLIPSRIALEMLSLAKKYHNKNVSSEVATIELSRMIEELPLRKRETFGMYLSFLREVAHFRSYNCMYPATLGMLTSSSFFAPSDCDPAAIVSYGSLLTKLLLILPVRIYMPKLEVIEKHTMYGKTT